MAFDPGNVLLTIGIFIGPGAPFIFREIIAFVLAFFLPRWLVHPINQLTLIIFPPIIRFEEKLEKYPRMSTILPRFLAAEVLLMIAGVVLIAVSRSI